jgi:hypothetical protein
MLMSTMSELLSLGYQPITSTNVKKYRLLERPDRSFQSMTLKSQGTCIPEPRWLFTDRLLSRSLEGQSHPR